MDGMDRLAGRIIEDARLECERIELDAQAQAREIALSFEQMAAQTEREIDLDAQKQAQERMNRAEALSAQQARKLLLNQKQMLIDGVFDKALEDILAMDEEKYVDFLASLAVKAARTGAEEVVFNPSDRARFGKRAVIEANRRLEAAGKTGALRLSVESRPVRGGLVLADGRVETNCSLELLVREARRDCALTVARILFED